MLLKWLNVVLKIIFSSLIWQRQLEEITKWELKFSETKRRAGGGAVSPVHQTRNMKLNIGERWSPNVCLIMQHVCLHAHFNHAASGAACTGKRCERNVLTQLTAGQLLYTLSDDLHTNLNMKETKTFQFLTWTLKNTFFKGSLVDSQDVFVQFYFINTVYYDYFYSRGEFLRNRRSDYYF